jgi:hypothetical protein
MITNSIFRTLIAALAFGICAAQSFGQQWRAVTDASGCTWARVKFVNQSDQPSHWTIWNGRAALDSTATTAVTDHESNWDGIVYPGETRYVWIYGRLAGEVNIANIDGGPSTYYPGAHLPVEGADAELLITIAGDGTVSATLEPGASYTVPAYTGNFDPAS